MRVAVLRGMLLLGLVLGAYGVLYVVDELLQHLEGEVSFAVAVTGSAIWGFGQLVPRAWRPSLWQAALLGAALIVALPIAITSRAFAAIPIALAAIAYAAARYVFDAGRLGPFWIALLVGVVTSPAAAIAATALEPERPVPAPSRTPPFPGADELAARFRPLLFLDSGERFEPLDVEDAIAAHDVRMCRYATGDDDCEIVQPGDAIDESFDYLVIDGDRLFAGERPGGPDSAYYYRVVRSGDSVFVDYWWFFALNPSPLEGRGFCAPGFRLPGVSCLEHAADWEGITVALDGESLEPVAVHYAQHTRVRRYDWDELERLWPAGTRRPLVFAARNSHASYPTRGDGIAEGPYDGRRPWSNNGVCDGCLKPLPTTEDGEPASWNAFTKPWGSQHCILFGTYCDRSRAPTAPSTQPRYRSLGATS